jgi:hypothetical protein
MKHAILIIIFVFINISIFSQVPNWSWARHTNGYPQGTGITTDGIGNIIIIGSFAPPTMTFGNIILSNYNSSGLNTDIFVVKYNPSGQIIWAKSFGDNFNDYCYGITTDFSCNIYITGNSTSDTLNLGGHILLNGGQIIAKLDSSGNVIWVNNYGEIGSAICYDNNNHIYSLGYYSTTAGSYNILGNDTLICAGGLDVIVVKFDTSGNIIKAIEPYGSSSEKAWGISSDNHSNIYITGNSGSTTLKFGNFVLSNTYGGGFVAKFDSSLNIIWARKIGNNYCEGSSVLCETNGNVYVTGYFIGNSITIGNTVLTTNTINSANIFIAKYDSSGNVLWAKGSAGVASVYPSRGFGLAKDSIGNIYLTGHYIGSNITFGTITLTNTTSYNMAQIFVAKYNTSGQVLWATSIGGNRHDYYNSIAIDFDDNLYLAGMNDRDTFAIGTDTMKNTGLFLAKMSDINTFIKPIQTENTVFIYPNPANRNFTMKIPRETKFISIFNSLGQVIEKRMTKNQNEVNFEIINVGLYFIQIVNDKESITKKVAICR